MNAPCLCASTSRQCVRACLLPVQNAFVSWCVCACASVCALPTNYRRFGRLKVNPTRNFSKATKLRLRSDVRRGSSGFCSAFRSFMVTIPQAEPMCQEVCRNASSVHFSATFRSAKASKHDVLLSLSQLLSEQIASSDRSPTRTVRNSAGHGGGRQSSCRAAL